MNSDKDMKSQNFDLNTKPITPFTIIFGKILYPED